ncbi:MAG TPA: YceI family protein [Elusimicrobiota bacterium]|jgi:polyisoprenoid-binding protein YceI|nr:YceI family protein [Elusimicrobiota bacterium]
MRNFAAFLSVFLAAASARATTYEIDAVHSQVGFKVRHMMAGKTPGRFERFSGTVEYDAKNPKSWSTQASIDAASINTGNEKRDGHLRSPDFFDTAKFPTLSFVSTGVRDWKDGKGKLLGKLTMHGVTKDVVMDLESGGESGDRAGFSATTKIDRRDYGIVWNKALDKGGVVVGNDVEISLEIEAVRKK